MSEWVLYYLMNIEWMQISTIWIHIFHVESIFDRMNEWMNACMQDEVSGRAREREEENVATNRPTNREKKTKKTRNFQSLELPDIMVYWYCNPNEQCTTPNDTRMGAVRESRMVVELNRLIFTKENGKKMLYTVLLLLLLLLPLPLLFW